MNEHSQVLTKPLNYWKTREIDELMQYKKHRSDLNGKIRFSLKDYKII